MVDFELQPGELKGFVPSWYGFGRAVNAFLDATPAQSRKEGVALLQHMYRQ
jgi:phosphoenolpyruvate carboxylase